MLQIALQIFRKIFSRRRECLSEEASCCDGNQLSQETLRVMRKQGIPPIIVNLIEGD